MHRGIDYLANVVYIQRVKALQTSRTTLPYRLYPVRGTHHCASGNQYIKNTTIFKKHFLLSYKVTLPIGYTGASLELLCQNIHRTYEHFDNKNCTGPNNMSASLDV